MALYDAKNITVAANARVRTSAEGVELPATLGSDTQWGADWHECGWIGEKGAEFSYSKKMKDIKVLQTLYPVLQIPEEITAGVSLELVEITKETFALAFGGGSWTTDGNIAKYTPAAPEYIDVRQIAIDWNFQGFNHRLVMWRSIISGDVKTTLAREEMRLPIEMALLGKDNADPWNYFTDNPAMIGTSATVTAPTLTGVAPTSGAVGDTITLTGSGFVAGMTVKFGSYTSQTVNVTSPTSATAVVPTGTTGAVQVTVTNTAGTSTGQSFTAA